jgi:hypothetical protein
MLAGHPVSVGNPLREIIERNATIGRNSEWRFSIQLIVYGNSWQFPATIMRGCHRPFRYHHHSPTAV